MASSGVEILGLTLAVAGWLGVMVACGLPMWRVAAYVGQNVVVSQVIWEGLWMNCSVQSTGQMHCKVHDSMLGLPRDLQAARALVVVSVAFGVAGVGLVTAGAQCTDCSQDVRGKRRLVVSGGLALTLAGFLTLVAVSWTAHAIVLGFYDPLLEDTGKRDCLTSCILPMWRVSAFIGVSIVTAQTIWEGIWMNCVVQSTGQMQCKIHDSMLALSGDLQAARALTVISIVLGLVGILVAMMGAKCTNCVEEERAKARVMIGAGVAFILASLTQLIPVSWSANAIIMEFYNPAIPEAQKREIGAALYAGWAGAALLLLGGGILCSSCPPQAEKYRPPSKIIYPPSRSIPLSGYEQRNYQEFLQRDVGGTAYRMSVGLELLGISLCILGWIIGIVACALPMWRVTAFIGSNIVTAQIIWEGLWMTCVVQSTGQMQCKVYDSMLALSQDLQAARALTVISILLAIMAVLIAITGAKCTNCIEEEASKAKVMIISGVFFIVSGVMQLIPVSWSANTIIRDFYNPLLTDAQRRELGAALYIGWAAAALLILGGGLLCCSCPPSEARYNNSRMAYSASRSAGGQGMERKDYV
ncbi:uncharacterized protein LOC133405311 [Phycodurus eques]|uniref:uncharacterized protein LOC133405311 n=1 Tax=Phycodurus eques TaxID=693459 RepID=UPI002ACD3EA4|nr:uncharacterized protein LOC133405311 [Phycodurus eques]